MKKHLKIVFLTLILLIILITSVQAIAPKVSTSLYKYEEIINEYEIWVVREVILAIVLIILIAVLTARKKKDSTKNYKGIKIAIGLIAAVMIIGSILLITHKNNYIRKLKVNVVGRDGGGYNKIITCIVNLFTEWNIPSQETISKNIKRSTPYRLNPSEPPMPMSGSYYRFVVDADGEKYMYYSR